MVRPDSRVRGAGGWPGRGVSATTRPLPGSPTSRAPWRVQASMRAPGTRAPACAVHPGGTRSVRAVANAPRPGPAATTRRTETDAATGRAALAEADAEADADAGA